MTATSSSTALLPRADDAPEVVPALLAASAEFRVGNRVEAKKWLGRAIQGALNAGHAQRALELTEALSRLGEPEGGAQASFVELEVGVEDGDLVATVPPQAGGDDDEAPTIPPAPATISSIRPPPPSRRPPPAPASKLPPPRGSGAPPRPPSSKPPQGVPRGSPSTVPPGNPPPPRRRPEPELVEKPVESKRSALDVVRWAVNSGEAMPPEGSIEGISLSDVPGIEDLPEDGQAELVARGKRIDLADQEEARHFGAALVLQGRLSVMPAIVDASAAHCEAGCLLYSEGTLAEGVELRLVSEGSSRIVTWSSGDMDRAIGSCFWVKEELQAIADRYQAFAGACMGALGDRLDEGLRAMVTERCEVRALIPEEQILFAGKLVPGLIIIGAGRIELFKGEVNVDTLGPGDFVGAEQVLSHGAAPVDARAGSDGALVLVAERMTAHELIVSLPPLLELLVT